MSEWNKYQWGTQLGQPATGYTPVQAGPVPGFSRPYAEQPHMQHVTDTKSPYEGDRFKPKKKVNDPVFLIFFILQVLDSSLRR
jgi:hypothetical protein